MDVFIWSRKQPVIFPAIMAISLLLTTLLFDYLGNPDYVKGKNVVVVGRSKIVGSPAAALFMWHHGTTTICHSRTDNLQEHCRRADILVVAIGQERLIKVGVVSISNY